jgi:hypothetical protein
MVQNRKIYVGTRLEQPIQSHFLYIADFLLFHKEDFFDIDNKDMIDILNRY